MKKTRILTSAAAFILILAGLFYLLLPHFDTFERKILERVLNQAANEYFNGSIRLRHVHIDKKLRIHLRRFYGELVTEGGPMAVEIQAIDSVDSLLNFAAGKPVRFDFRHARPASSGDEGLNGAALLKAGRDGYLEVKSEIATLALNDLEKLSPENLTGSTGKLKGTFYFRSAGEKADFSLEVKVREPGGMIQARFFDAVLPYLPQIPNRANVEKLAGEARLVPYRQADFTIRLVDPSKMKVFFHILVPDYNLNLNLNVEIRVDRDNAFMELAQLLGLIRIAGGSAAVRGQ